MSAQLPPDAASSTEQRLDDLVALLEHLREEAVSAYEELARGSSSNQSTLYAERAAWLGMVTPADLRANSQATASTEWLLVRASGPDRDALTSFKGASTEPAAEGWSLGRCLLWLAENRALMRVLTGQDGTAEVLVTVRPPSHPEDVLEVRRACPADAPLTAIAAALEEAACLLTADENRRRLRLVVGTARVQDP